MTSWVGFLSLVCCFKIPTFAAVATKRVGLVNAAADVLLLITVWWITFTVVVTLVLCLGFGPSGVVAGEWVGFYGSLDNG
jgi:hypothetical protein